MCEIIIGVYCENRVCMTLAFMANVMNVHTFDALVFTKWFFLSLLCAWMRKRRRMCAHM